MAIGEVEEGVEAALKQLCPDVLEADVLAFLVASLAGDDDEEQDADDIGDSLAGFSPSFASLAPAEQRQAVEDLLRRVAAVKAEARAAAAAAAAAAAPTTAGAAAKPSRPLAAVVAQTLSRLSSLSVGGGGRGGGSSAAPSEGDGSDGGSGGAPATCMPEQQAAVRLLRELCALPAETSDAFLVHLLSSKGGGDVEAAAAWMLECPDLGAAQQAWQQARQRRREERARAAAEREAAKKEIVSRFHLQAVPNGSSSGGGGKGGKPPVLQAWGAGGKGACTKEQGKVRYLEGQVATRAGQKYVVVDKGEEWDGGSRGKVYTKGKRGKGFA